MEIVTANNLGSMYPAMTASSSFTLTLFNDPECDAFVNTRWRQQTTLTQNNYYGTCINANTMAPEIRFAKWQNPTSIDLFAEELETWQSLTFESDGWRKLCIYQGFNCDGDWYEVLGSNTCREPRPDWPYLSYRIATTDFSCEPIYEGVIMVPETDLSDDSTQPAGSLMSNRVSSGEETAASKSN